MTEPLLTARQVGELLGLSTETVLRKWRKGDLPGFRIASNVLRFAPADINAWLQATRQGSGAGGEAPTTPTAGPTRGVLLQVPTTPIRGEDDDGYG